MEANELHNIALKVIERMKSGELPNVVKHQDLVTAIKQEAPRVDGRRAWNALMYVYYLLRLSCRKKLLWRNRFSLKGVHGKGSKRQLEYHREVCVDCLERVECLSEETVFSYLNRHRPFTQS